MKISIVATLYYSEGYIAEFYRRVTAAVKKITPDYEIVFVNDGSPDKSLEKVLAIQQEDSRVMLVDLSRNFGHHKAIMTGLRFAEGDYVFLIDTDLEEEPELLTVFWSELQAKPDLDVVYGIQKSRKGGWFERISGYLFYKLFNFIAGYEYPANPFTARLMSQRYIQGLRTFNEKEIDLWGLFILNGFKQAGLTLTKKSKGTTTYTFKRKLRIAVDTITSFTSRPLYIIFLVGLFITLVSTINIIYIVYQKLAAKVTVDGYTSLFASIWFIGGGLMFTLGIIGIYLSKIFLEIKNRPLTIIKGVYKIEQ
jgi:putative glycosyltransferase